MSATPSAPTVSAPSTVLLLAPLDGAPVDGSAALFEWEAVRGARAYRLQIANDAAFEDVYTTIEAERSTLLTLYAMLPENGAPFFWRVQAQTSAGWQPWSEGVRFTAASDQQVFSYEAAQARRVEDEGFAGAAPLPADAPLYQTDHTSGAAVLGFFAMMIVSFIIIFVLIVGAVNDMQETPSGAAVGTRDQAPAAIDEAMQNLVDEAQDPQQQDAPE